MGSHNKAATEVAAHSVKDTEVHGVGASPVCSETEVIPLVGAGGFYVIATGEAGILLVLKPEGATVADFQANPATGDFLTPEGLNDNNVTSMTYCAAVDKYCEVAFDVPVKITRFRHYGSANNTTTTG
ncbi:unnamed protein product, partial [marine sediment metagenome]